MNLLVLADHHGIRHDLTAEPADLVLSLGDVADLVLNCVAFLFRPPLDGSRSPTVAVLEAMVNRPGANSFRLSACCQESIGWLHRGERVFRLPDAPVQSEHIVENTQP
jgi:hypothetical protein